MTHTIRWIDYNEAAIDCDEERAGYMDKDETRNCTRCGKSLYLHFDVRVIEK